MYLYRDRVNTIKPIRSRLELKNRKMEINDTKANKFASSNQPTRTSYEINKIFDDFNNSIPFKKKQSHKFRRNKFNSCC